MQVLRVEACALAIVSSTTGLLSFLVAQLLYLAPFRQGVVWFPNRRALGITLTLGAALYAVCYGTG